MPSSKLWPGAPGSHVEPPGPIPVREKHEHPEVWINGKHWSWEPGEESGIPEEALAVWRAYEEANP